MSAYECKTKTIRIQATGIYFSTIDTQEKTTVWTNCLWDGQGIFSTWLLARRLGIA